MAGTTTYYGISYPTSTDYVKDGAAAIQTVATGFDSAVAIPSYNAQTGTTYTFALTDVGKTVTASNAAAQTYTIPPTASVAWAANTTLRVLNLGAGVVTFAAGAGVTVTNTAQTLAQYQSAQLVRTGLNAWTVTPDSGISATGLTLIKTQTIGTAVTSVAVTDVFSATYDSYRIICTGGVLSSTQLLNLAMGTGVGTSYFGARTATNTSSAAALQGDNNTTSWQYAGAGNTGFAIFSGDLHNPFTAKNTLLDSLYMEAASALGRYAGYLSNTTSYTGFTILVTGAGTITGGTLAVYGYNK
jgi:predicted aspartyl protease